VPSSAHGKGTLTHLAPHRHEVTYCFLPASLSSAGHFGPDPSAQVGPLSLYSA
jgi:hypothetical protein